jgi:uncharacterized membrane protein YecN with MAPEG domain
LNLLKLLPAMLSFLLLAAHFYRAGEVIPAALSLALPSLLLLREKWVVWIIQAALLLGSVEWIRTLVLFARQRIEFGQPWTRLAVILGAVALFTALSALVFRSESLRRRYRG